MKFNKNELVKSPLNYTGGKFKLLPQILPLLPENIDRFVDLFCGGANVGVNVNANKIVCNDIENHVIEFLQKCKELNSQEIINILKNTISTYGLSKTNREGFEKIREDYNNGNNSWNMFYAMVTNAFNYQIRFNKNGGYNMPFGKDRSWFSPELEKKLIKFVDCLKTKEIKFINKDFSTIKIETLTKDDLVYCDPPYLITCASYNEQDGWNETKERQLYELLDNIHSQGSRFAFSNVFESKGKSNDMLKEWSKKYTVNYLNHTYGNCNYHAKDKSENSTVEVLITNYNSNNIEIAS